MTRVRDASTSELAYALGGVASAWTEPMKGSAWIISVASSMSANIGAHDYELIATSAAACASSLVFHQITSIQRSPCRP